MSDRKPTGVRRFYKGKLFIYFAALIPTVIYLNRFLVPDTSYDSMYYHIFNGLRASENLLWPFSKHEFYPSGFGTLAPLYDFLNNLTRQLLGFRLGTILSLIAYIGVILISFKFFELIVSLKRTKLDNFIKLVLFLNSVVVTELLFQLATYFVDIIDTFLVLLALYLFLIYIKSRQQRLLWISSLIFGVTLLAKATNIIFVIPFVALFIFDQYKQRAQPWRKRAGTILVVGLVLIVPTLLYDFKNLILTGNPFFPLYNGIFKSSDYASVSFSPAAYGFGGTDFLQKLFWPIVSFWHAARLSSPHNIFNDWKLGITWLIAGLLFIPIFWKKLRQTERYMVVFFFLSMLIWGFSSGIMRYIAPDDVIGGALLAVLVVKINELPYKKTVTHIMPAMLLVPLIIVANYRIINFNLRYDISWRPTFVYDRQVYMAQAKQLFNDSLSNPAAVNPNLNNSQIMLNCIPQSTGLISLSGYANKPILNIMSQPPNQQMVEQANYRRQAASKLVALYKTYNVSFATYVISDRAQVNFQTCLNNISAVGGQISKIVLLNFFLGYAAYERPVIIFGSLNLHNYLNSPTKPNVSIINNLPLSQYPNQSALLNYILTTLH